MKPEHRYYKSKFPYADWRKGQDSAICNILDTIFTEGKKYVIVRAPTGSGKSAIAMTLAQVLNEAVTVRAQGLDDATRPGSPTTDRESQTLMVTPKKVLQDQYASDFANYEDLVVLKGRSNYKCGIKPSLTGDKCPGKNRTELDRYKRKEGLTEADEPQRPCFGCQECEFSQTVMASLEAPITVCNLHTLKSWLLYKRVFDRIDKHRQIAIVDECHLLPAFLTELYSTSFDLKDIEREILAGDPDDETPEESIEGEILDESTRYALACLKDCRRMFDAIRDGSFTLYGMDPSAMKDLIVMETIADQLGHTPTIEDVHRLQQLRDRFEEKYEFSPEDFVFSSNGGFSETIHWLLSMMQSTSTDYKNAGDSQAYYKWLRKAEILREFIDNQRKLECGNLEQADMPYFTDVVAEAPHILTIGCKRPSYGFHRLMGQFAAVVLMSATVVPTDMAVDLGLAKDKTHIEVVKPSTSVDVRPLIYLGGYDTSLSYKNKDKAFPVVSRKIASLARFHSNWRGVIHTNSKDFTFRLRDQLRELLSKRELKRFIFHFGGPKEREMVKFMKDTSDNSIIVSPSLVEGFDGKGDVARWQVIMKVPFPPRNGALVKARLLEGEDGERWYNAQVADALAQAYGRVNRGPGDLGVTYIMDGLLGFFLKNVTRYGLWATMPEAFAQALAAMEEFVYVQGADGNWVPFPFRNTSKRARNAEMVIKPKGLFK